MAKIDVKCPFFGQTEFVKKHGLGKRNINVIAARFVAELSSLMMNRKTLGYSKSTEMHDKRVSTFIKRERYLS